MYIEELATKPIFYIDMDGVVAWLEKFLADYFRKSLKEIEYDSTPYWMEILKKMNMEDFFSNLEMEPHALELIQYFLDRNLTICFLTRPARAPHTEASIVGKKRWLIKHGLSNIPVIFEKKKEKYAMSGKIPNVLLDDQADNIAAWNLAGGLFQEIVFE